MDKNDRGGLYRPPYNFEKVIGRTMNGERDGAHDIVSGYCGITGNLLFYSVAGHILFK